MACFAAAPAPQRCSRRRVAIRPKIIEFMMVRNMHEHRFAASPAAVGKLIDSLAGKEDCLWPKQAWPPMRFDRPLGVGADGGHGPIGYIVEAYRPGSAIRFRFTRPAGFIGYHEYSVVSHANRAILRHFLEMRLKGGALCSWPLLFRPLHDALIEDSLDRAEWELTGAIRRKALWTARVRFLRSVIGMVWHGSGK